MTLRDKFQDWLEQADFENILMTGFMALIAAMCLIIFIVAVIASIATILT